MDRNLQFLEQNSINSNQFRILFSHSRIRQTTATDRALKFDRF